MSLIYLTAIFVVCIAIFSVYIYKIGNNNNEVQLIFQDMDNKLKQIKKYEYDLKDISNRFERLMQDPIDSINKMLSLLEPVNKYDQNIIGNVHKPLSELSNLKSQIESINNKITRFEMDEVLTNIENLQNDLIEFKNINKEVFSLTNLKNSIANFNILESDKLSLNQTLKVIDSFMSTLKTELLKIQNSLKTIPKNVDVIGEIQKLQAIIQMLPNILTLSSEIKDNIFQLVTSVGQIKIKISNKKLLKDVMQTVSDTEVTISEAVNNISNINTLLTSLKTAIDSLKHKLPIIKENHMFTKLEKDFKALKEVEKLFETYSDQLQEIKNNISERSGVLDQIQLEFKMGIKELNDKIDNLKKLKNLDENPLLNQIKNKIELLHSCNVNMTNINNVLNEIKNKTDSLENCKDNIVETSPILNEIKTKVDSLKHCKIELTNKNLFLKEIEDNVEHLLEKNCYTEINTLNQIKTKIDSLKEYKSNLLESYPLVNEIKTKISLLENCNDTNPIVKQILSKISSLEQIDVSEKNIFLKQIKTNSKKTSANVKRVKHVVGKLMEQYRKLNIYFKHYTINLENDASIVFKNNNKVHRIVIKKGIVTFDFVTKSINRELNRFFSHTKNTFTLTTDENTNFVHIKSSIPFHMDNHLRALLGFEPVEVEMFQNEYTSTKPHNIDDVRLNALIHKHSIDKIVNTISSKFINNLTDDDLKKIYKQLIESFKFITNQYNQRELEGIFDIFYKMYLLHEDIQDTLKLKNNEDYTLNNILDKIESQFQDRLKNILTKTDFVPKQLITTNHNFIKDATAKIFKRFIEELDTGYTDAKKTIDKGMDEITALVSN